MHLPGLIRLRNRWQSQSFEDSLRFSDDEIHFFWHFVQGSIMDPETRWSLRRHWGMCDRHTFGFIAAEAAYCHGFLMGQSVLYHDLMERAADAFHARAPFYEFRVAWRLRETKPCFMCRHGFKAESQRRLARSVIEEGRNLEPLLEFARETAPGWREFVCGVCAGTDSPVRCRKHLRSELVRGKTDLESQRAMVERLYRHADLYMRSFIWNDRGETTLEDRASLIGSIGWLTGWKPWLLLMQSEPVAVDG